jgi:hypothetical protein
MESGGRSDLGWALFIFFRFVYRQHQPRKPQLSGGRSLRILQPNAMAEDRSVVYLFSFYFNLD